MPHAQSTLLRGVLLSLCSTLLAVCLASGTVVLAQESLPPVVPPVITEQQTEQTAAQPSLSIAVDGVSETRFNPTYGTVFFTVSGGDLADAGRDARITADDRPLAPTRTSYSNRIVAGTYQFSPGPHRLALSGWDALGQPIATEARIWTGELPLLVRVTDLRGEPITGATVVVSLVQQERVRASQASREGIARFENLPDERLRVEVNTIEGDADTRIVPARQRFVEFRMAR